MKLDTTFSREIKKANGDGGRADKFAFLKTAKAAARELSTPEVMRGAYDEAIKKYGRVSVAICTAATIKDRKERLSPSMYEWACRVLELWTNRPSDIGELVIRDNLHPTRIEEYAAGLIEITQEAE